MNDMVFGKRFIALTVLSVLFSMNDLSAKDYDQDAIKIESRPGNVIFSHQSHESVSCIKCHHNVSDNNREYSCRACHKKQNVISPDGKKAFHQVCIGCHLKDKIENKKTGPAKLCSNCHLKE